ncbi:MAG TPA: hypothetical protein VHH88_11825, partial [Verrucomicrobiae bacterium]|nr:hypothetical protein [Verrucomicrobiae bacterium]
DARFCPDRDSAQRALEAIRGSPPLYGEKWRELIEPGSSPPSKPTREQLLKQLTVPLAYKYVASSMMVAEANQCAQRLKLPGKFPMDRGQLRKLYIAPPLLMGFMGAIDTDQWSFGFSEYGRIRYVTRLGFFEDRPLPELQNRLAAIPANTSTNTAYEMATNWLAAMAVDVSALEAAYPPDALQHFFYAGGGGKILLPIFDVVWEVPGKRAVIVTLYGPTGDLLQLREEDESFSRQPPRHVKNIQSLLAISNDEFQRYPEEQRAKLIKESGS